MPIKVGNTRCRTSASLSLFQDDLCERLQIMRGNTKNPIGSPPTGERLQRGCPQSYVAHPHGHGNRDGWPGKPRRQVQSPIKSRRGHWGSVPSGFRLISSDGFCLRLKTSQPLRRCILGIWQRMHNALPCTSAPYVYTADITCSGGPPNCIRMHVAWTWLRNLTRRGIRGGGRRLGRASRP